eukprot:scaffold20392_cov55-Attheya_sp.AAC.2
MTTPSIKVTYFDIEGRAEPIRLALKLAQLPFEDERIKFPEWQELKPKTPYGQLPLLTVDGKMKSQSDAMIRWVGSIDPANALYPAEKLYEIEEAMGVINDLSTSWGPSMYMGMRPENYGYPVGFGKTPEGIEKISSMRKQWIETQLPKFLTHLSDMIEQNGGIWLCSGEKPTIADCAAVATLRSFTRGHIDHVDPECINKANPKLVEYVEQFCSLPEIKGSYTNGIGSS